jgi:hypothetical protein
MTWTFVAPALVPRAKNVPAAFKTKGSGKSRRSTGGVLMQAFEHRNQSSRASRHHTCCSLLDWPLTYLSLFESRRQALDRGTRAKRRDRGPL